MEHSLDIAQIESMLKRTENLGEFYRNAYISGTSATAKFLETSIDKLDEWTYSVLLHSSPIQNAVIRMLADVRGQLSVYQFNSRAAYQFEVLLAIDNSGTMCPIRAYIAEIVVILSEMFKR